ncbi:TPA: hypothetical protein F3L15_09515 [Aeromonas hydrophila]|uniref:hypothetical protein n=1 Tax=Aeromonas hydrophila TaxID=644 RepID=UPI0005CF4ED1|nr:hypothetical protein [Aeromonas hydrophila]AJQ53978.1 hypothetical protein RY45_07720 [Aeromonas hydrophila]TNH91739.1 hypothetical protein CF139_02540 [Aeromonas hydrophila]HAU4884254.1 hypothetical protein [Aeromonas hydrophila]
MTIKHTPEPWHECAEGKCGCGQILGPESVYIATVKDPATRRRIVACVNACRGLPTDELEQKGLVAAVGTQLLEADQLRDELLAALEEVHRIASNSNMTHNMMVIRDHCADAIAKAKGGAA